MSLRPRYSLLTLLVLTALVAGGVKLWYGPHRVSSDEEKYTYTNSLNRGKVIHGVSIIRIFDARDSLYHIQIGYYRQGIELEISYHIFYSGYSEISELNWSSSLLSLLTSSEQQEFLDAIKQERAFLHKYDDGPIVEGYAR